MYQIRHHLGTNMVLCRDTDSLYLHWQDAEMLPSMPEVSIVQATTADDLAEILTVFSCFYPVWHEDLVIMEVETGRIVEMNTRLWKSFDQRVTARIVAKQLNIDLETWNLALHSRGAYIDDLEGRAKEDYMLSKLFSDQVPPPGSITRINYYGRLWLKSIAANRTNIVPHAVPRHSDDTASATIGDDGEVDPKYMYGVPLTFWQEVAVTLGLTAVFKGNKE